MPSKYVERKAFITFHVLLLDSFHQFIMQKQLILPDVKQDTKLLIAGAEKSH